MEAVAIMIAVIMVSIIVSLIWINLFIKDLGLVRLMIRSHLVVRS